MCGRFTLRTPQQLLVKQFALDATPTLFPRYNIAPSQGVAIVRNSVDGQRELAIVQWGLIPGWAKDPSIANQLINARSETAASKPAFRSAFRQRRCLIPADGFYEWQKVGRKKQPFWIRLPDAGAFGLAGLWERWRDPAGQDWETCTILTRDAIEKISHLHTRMPVIVDPGDYEAWLDPAKTDPAQLMPLLESRLSDQLTFSPVATIVNSPAVDDEQCIAPAPAAERTLFD